MASLENFHATKRLTSKEENNILSIIINKQYLEYVLEFSTS